MNLAHYVTIEDYSNVAGSQWPSYEDFLKNNYTVTSDVKHEIDQFILNAKKVAQTPEQWTLGPVDKKLAQCVTVDDYTQAAGPGWPTYQDFINGAQTTNLEIQTEIDLFRTQHLEQGEKFPINTATACQSKWTWSTIWINSLSSASCHRVTPTKFDIKDFDNFHNLPKKIADRKLMLAGEWPSGGCEYCKDIEHSGGWSDRQHNLGIRGLTPPELLTDPTATHVSPRIVEIFAQNTCNLSCVYCFPEFSSKIEQENIKFGLFDQGGVSIPVLDKPAVAAEQYYNKFLDWLDRNVQTLGRLHLLGGETFIQHKLMNAVLDILERKPSPDLQFCVFSNLNVPDSAWDRYLPRIKELQAAGNIWVFDLTASIDCWGPEQSYVRSGLDLDQFESRFAWAAEQGSWLRLNVNQTITSMTIRTMPDLINKINQYNQHRHIGHYFQFFTGPQMFQHPKHYAWETWENDFERIFAAMPQRTVEQQEAIPRMQGIQSLLKSHNTYNYTEINKLRIYFDELDRRRNTNWRQLFSYLDLHP